MWNKLKLSIALSTLFAMSGCATVSTAPVVSDYCRIARPIGYDSTADSADTIAEIEAHNSRWVCLCEGDCPAERVAN